MKLGCVRPSQEAHISRGDREITDELLCIGIAMRHADLRELRRRGYR